jgi:type IV secretion system protein VirB2
MIAGWNESSVAGAMIRMMKAFLTCIATLWAAAGSTAALAQDSLSNANPEGSGVLVRAVQWLQGTLLGTIATVVAVIAVASVGFLMLTGRINWRYGATVILGCFILFGAASIVAGIQSTASYGN